MWMELRLKRDAIENPSLCLPERADASESHPNPPVHIFAYYSPILSVCGIYLNLGAATMP